MNMTRIRIARPDVNGILQPMHTVYLDSTVADAGDALVHGQGLQINDVVYMDDFFLQLTQTTPVKWRAILPLDPRLDGLYTRMIAHEDAATLRVGTGVS